jgi:hypothetical protein
MKRLWNLFLSLSKSRQITLIVLILHAALLIFGLTDHLLTKQNIKKQAMIVRTFVPQIEPPKITSSQIAVKPQAQKITAQKKQLPIQSAIAKKTKKEEPPPLNSELLSQIAKSLNTVASNPQTRKMGAPLSLPKTIRNKTEIEPSSTQNQSYAENLIAILTNNLDLPEFGAVKASIEISASGSLLNCTILEEKSHKNSEFLKNRLRELTFPCFNDFGLSDNQLEFTITFRNLES